MNAPGSPSSALQITNFCTPNDFATVLHFKPVGYPAPPRPRNPLFVTCSITSRGVISVSAWRRAWYPSAAM